MASRIGPLAIALLVLRQARAVDPEERKRHLTVWLAE